MKTFIAFISDSNSCVFWGIFTLYVPMETGTNTLGRSYKIKNLPRCVSTLPDKAETTKKFITQQQE